jgi:hypothetical protein
MRGCFLRIQSSMLSFALQDLRSCSELFDITLSTDAGEVKAHKVVLSACSPYFREVLTRSSNLTQTNLIIYLRGVKQSDLEVKLLVHDVNSTTSSRDLSSRKIIF